MINTIRPLGPVTSLIPVTPTQAVAVEKQAQVTGAAANSSLHSKVQSEAQARSNVVERKKSDRAVLGVTAADALIGAFETQTHARRRHDDEADDGHGSGGNAAGGRRRKNRRKVPPIMGF